MLVLIAAALAACDGDRERGGPQAQVRKPVAAVRADVVPATSAPAVVQRAVGEAWGGLADGPSRRAYELARTGDVAGAERLGPDATLGLLLALREFPFDSGSRAQHRRDQRKQLALLEALGRVGDERALQPLTEMIQYRSGALGKAYADAVAAIWARLGAHAPGARPARPTVRLRWYAFECWRPTCFDMERQLDRLLADAGVDRAAPDATTFDAILMLEYREREGAEFQIRLGVATATTFRLAVDVVDLRRRTIVPLAATGGVSDRFTLGPHRGLERADELHELGVTSLRASLAELGPALAAALR